MDDLGVPLFQEPPICIYIIYIYIYTQTLFVYVYTNRFNNCMQHLRRGFSCFLNQHYHTDPYGAYTIPSPNQQTPYMGPQNERPHLCFIMNTLFASDFIVADQLSKQTFEQLCTRTNYSIWFGSLVAFPRQAFFSISNMAGLVTAVISSNPFISLSLTITSYNLDDRPHIFCGRITSFYKHQSLDFM